MLMATDAYSDLQLVCLSLAGIVTILFDGTRIGPSVRADEAAPRCCVGR